VNAIAHSTIVHPQSKIHIKFTIALGCRTGPGVVQPYAIVDFIPQ
jgi:hypothetical protein